MKKMTSKQWLIAFLATVILLAAGVVAFNWLVDPFGVFSHEALEWPSYEMTVNPRAAKATYLEKHHDEYDSYILGCSSSSSFPVETLNEALDAKFYNYIVYGADLLDSEQQAAYLIENYEVKNLVVNVYLDNACSYDEESNPLSFAMPASYTGGSAAKFFAKYLFMDPRYSLNKLKAMPKDTYLTQSFDVFNEETGAYDKKVRDAERIADLETYLESYPCFVDYPQPSATISEEAVQGTIDSVARIKALCEENGVNLLVVASPVYWEYMAHFSWDDVADFYTRLAQVTDFWDFSYSSVSFEPRYFYDDTHFRNCVGEMALARIFGDEDQYIPDDFGVLVTAENAAQHFADAAQSQALEETDLTAQVPVLMYHSIGAEGNSDTVITPELFEEHMAALAEAGYTAIFPDDLAAYVNQGKALPDKPVLITFDDGYYNNYEYAWPILEKYGLVATIFPIGSTAGDKETYKDTDYPITPHFTWEEGKEMVDSGVISLQSHTYDMHQWAPYEDSSQGEIRENILPLDGESESDYRVALAEDCQLEREAITQGTGQETVRAIAFPSGKYDTLSQVVLLENGYDISFTTEEGSNTLVKGLPQSLLGMHRYTMSEAVSTETLLDWVADARG